MAATTARRPQPHGGFRPNVVGNPAMWDVVGIVPQRLPTLKEATVLERERRGREAAFSLPNLERRYEHTLNESAALRFMPIKGGRLRAIDHVARRPPLIPSYGTNSYGQQKAIDSRRKRRKPSNAGYVQLPDILSSYRVSAMAPPPMLPVPLMRLAPLHDTDPEEPWLGETLNTLPPPVAASDESIARRQQLGAGASLLQVDAPATQQPRRMRTQL